MNLPGFYELPFIPLGSDWDWIDMATAYIDCFGAPIPRWLFDLAMSESTGQGKFT